MRQFLSLIFVVVLLLSSSVHADIPLPKDQQYVDPRVQFDGLDQCPDHVFYLRFLTFTGGPGGVPHRLVAVKNGTAFALNAQRRLFDMSLLAMDRKEFEKRAKEDPSLKWLTDKTDGVVKAAVQPPSTVAPVSQKEVPVTAYRVTLKDGKLTAEKIAPMKTGNATPSGLLPLWAIGLLGATGLTWAGLWFARRRNTTNEHEA